VRTLSVVSTQSFRIVAVYLAIFACSATALLGFVYWNTTLVLDRETDETIRAEVTGLVEQYQGLGLPALTDAIINRSVRGEQGIYVLAGADRRPIAGNLDSWPQLTMTADDFAEFEFERRVGGVPELHRARGRVFTLSQGGFLLLVARDVEDRRAMENLLATALPWSMALVIVLGLVGGVLVSRNLLARLDAINRTSRQIMAGDFSKRVPVTKKGDEFDDLSNHLNRMLDRIERLMRGMREVSDNVAHDLRSPLNRLRSRLEQASRHQADPDMQRDIEAAVEETDRLIATFNALLLIAEAEAGSVRESMEDFDLREAIEGVSELYEPLAEEKGVRLVVRKDRRPAVVSGNRNLISQALANLVDNAIKYSPAGSEVVVALEHGESGASLVVADNGPGIPEEDLTRVTERFVRLESSRHSPGTGLGLSLVSAVARLHEAELILSDNQPGLRVDLRFQRTKAIARPVRAPARLDLTYQDARAAHS
jgi:signal transduction histidine kinase